MRSYLAAAALAFVSLARPGDARACGGVFTEQQVQQGPDAFVADGQRIVLAVSSTRTVLWSQIHFSGKATDFAWVLPVGAGARLELGEDAWFEALDAFTTTRVVPPALLCNEATSSGGCGCGSAADAAGGTNGRQGTPEESVTVVHQGSVGPYETVTLSAASGDSAQAWLASHGYAVPADVAPVLDAYAAMGMDFLAMRLAPGAGTAQMQPVRIITEGGSPMVPLRMMLAGTGAHVPIELFVIGEGRYQPAAFPNALVDASKVSWDFQKEASSYADVRSATLAQGDGRAFLTSYARNRLDITLGDGTENGSPTMFESTSGWQVTTLPDLYVGQAAGEGGTVPEACRDLDARLASADGSEIVETCDPHDAGCGPTGQRVPADVLACGEWTDLATALVGMRPASVWLTRLEADLPRAALDIDLVLEPEPGQNEVLSVLAPGGVAHIPAECSVENGGTGAAAVAAGDAGPRPRPRRMPLAPLAMAMALGVGLLRRWRRRRLDAAMAPSIERRLADPVSIAG